MTQNFGPTLWLLLGTSGFVLLIVCASIANLMLARMVRRERELSVRAAGGHAERRVARPLHRLGGAVGAHHDRLAVAGIGQPHRARRLVEIGVERGHEQHQPARPFGTAPAGAQICPVASAPREQPGDLRYRHGGRVDVDRSWRNLATTIGRTIDPDAIARRRGWPPALSIGN